MPDRTRPPMNALEVTEWLLRMPPPYSSGLVVNRPDGGMTHSARLFQARMWRAYAMEWDLPAWHVRRRWVEMILRRSRADCLRRARINLYLARRLRRIRSAP
jgi:hypothetical protein